MARMNMRPPSYITSLNLSLFRCQSQLVDGFIVIVDREIMTYEFWFLASCFKLDAGLGFCGHRRREEGGHSSGILGSPQMNQKKGYVTSHL
jgi:hypothetical protein